MTEKISPKSIRTEKRKKPGGRDGNNQKYTRGRGRYRFKLCDNGHHSEASQQAQQNE